MFTIPDKGQGAHDLQSIFFQGYLDILVAGLNGTECVLSGGAVTAQGSPDMTVAVAKAAVLSVGALLAAVAGNVTVTTADATNPRIDLIVVDASGTKACRAGTAAASPKPAARTAGDVALAYVYVPAGATTITSARLVDLRVMRTQGPILIKKDTAAQTQNTSNSAVSYLSVTIPNGLFLAGRVLRIRLGGNYLANNATPTFTLTIAYGGTTMFADVTVATTNDTDRGAWRVDFDLVAQANNDQALSGLAVIQTPGAKTVPTSGQAGDFAVVTSVVTPIAGSAAVDSDAADRTLTVQWTMSVSNAADEIVRELSTVELL